MRPNRDLTADGQAVADAALLLGRRDDRNAVRRVGGDCLGKGSQPG